MSSLFTLTDMELLARREIENLWTMNIPHQYGSGVVADRKRHVMLENKGLIKEQRNLVAVLGYLLLECGQLTDDKSAVEVTFTKFALQSLRDDYLVEWRKDPLTGNMTFHMDLKPKLLVAEDALETA